MCSVYRSLYNLKLETISSIIDTGTRDTDTVKGPPIDVREEVGVLAPASYAAVSLC
jgi:hypothetical protein